MRKQAAITSALLSLLFIVVYGACNAFTQYRTDVGTFYFEWERQIPFVPAMIVPYMSIDLFFIIAPFLCTSDAELRTFRRRIIACILIAAACFLVFPLKYTFDRPFVPGPLGVVFNNFRKLDLPFNEFPSLHIALRAVLVGVYVRHSKGWARWAVHVWFSLIGLSTLLVYQHHLIDIAGGFVLAAVVYALFREQPVASTRNLRVGAYYLLGALLLVLAAMGWKPWGLLLLWPAASLMLMSTAYFWAGADVYRKINGRVGRWSKVALWPVLIGQRLSLAYYARECRAWDALTKNVWIGRKLNENEARKAVAEGVTAVLDLAGEFSAPPAFRQMRYRSIPVLDLTAPTAAQLEQSVAFIKEESRRGVVYVHCKAGYSRTAAVAGAWLLASAHATDAAQAVMLLKCARPTMVVRPEALMTLEKFAATQGAAMGV